MYWYVYYVDWIACVEWSLHVQDESYLIVVYNIFDELLNSFAVAIKRVWYWNENRMSSQINGIDLNILRHTFRIYYQFIFDKKGRKRSRKSLYKWCWKTGQLYAIKWTQISLQCCAQISNKNVLKTLIFDLRYKTIRYIKKNLGRTPHNIKAKGIFCLFYFYF